MKTRVMSALLVLLIIVPVLMTGSFEAYAKNEDVSGYAAGSNEELDVISGGINALKLAGLTTSSTGNWGAHQTRYVTTSSGKYLGVELETPVDYIVNGERWYYAVLVRINDDGSCDKLYTDFYVGGQAALSLMVDKEEDIWMYSGDADGHFLDANIWHYDVSADQVTNYKTQQRVGKFGEDGASYKKSTPVIDPENGKIYAILTVGNVPGWFGWCEFDIETKEWQPYQAAEIPANVHYNYSYADGNGGFFTVAERCTQVIATKSDVEGMKVSDAQRIFRSRDKDAGDVWDQLCLIHVPDPSVPDFELIIVEEATYDVRNGLYPTQMNAHNDVFVDSNGNFHVLYLSHDDGKPGYHKYHKIYDPSDNFKLLYSGAISFLYGPNAEYDGRFFEDTEGNFYILASSCNATSQIEVWKATDDLNSQFELVHNEELTGISDNRGTGSFIVANSRGNSTTGDIANIAVSRDGTWYVYEIDLRPFAD